MRKGKDFRFLQPVSQGRALFFLDVWPLQDGNPVTGNPARFTERSRSDHPSRAGRAPT